MEDILFIVVDYLSADGIKGLLSFRSSCKQHYSIVEKHLIKFKYVDYKILRLVLFRFLYRIGSKDSSFNCDWGCFTNCIFLPEAYAFVNFNKKTNNHELNFFTWGTDSVECVLPSNIQNSEIFAPSIKRLEPLFILDKLLLIFLDKKTNAAFVVHFDVQMNDREMMCNLIYSIKYLPNKHHSIVDKFYLPLAPKRYNFYNHQFITIVHMTEKGLILSNVMKNDREQIVSLMVNLEDVRSILFDGDYRVRFFHSTHPYIIVLTHTYKSNPYEIIILHLKAKQFYKIQTREHCVPLFTNDWQNLWFLADGLFIRLTFRDNSEIQVKIRETNRSFELDKHFLIGKNEIRFFSLRGRTKTKIFPLKTSTSSYSLFILAEVKPIVYDNGTQCGCG